MRCKQKGCDTILSQYNPGEFCWTHTLDMSQTDRPAKHIRYHLPVMRNRFVQNIEGAYDFPHRRHW